MSEELLKQILDKISGMEGELKSVNRRMDNIENRMVTKVDLDHAKNELMTQLNVISTGQQGTREEITQRFKEVKQSIHNLRSDIEFTYEKTSKNELELHRLKNQ